MMVALVSALATVLLRQLDAVSFYSIDGANVNTVGPITSMCSLITLLSVMYPSPALTVITVPEL
jgi:uncharacterized protein (DUF58 family)